MAYTTRRPMLEGMRNNQDSAWQEFRSTYAPLIQLIATKKHLTKEESAELSQDVCVKMVQRNALEKYDATRGKFRTYLGRIINNCATDIIRKRPKPSQITTRQFNNIPADSTPREAVSQNEDDSLLQLAMDNVRARCDDLTFLAFEFHSRQHRPAKEVAKELGVSEEKVYLSSSRIIQRLKKEIERLKAEEKL